MKDDKKSVNISNRMQVQISQRRGGGGSPDVAEYNLVKYSFLQHILS